MTSEFASFGSADRFQIALRWTGDSEPRGRRPAASGWSVGDLRIVVSGQVITRSRRGAAIQSHVGWYLAPFAGWLATNWVALLHEEDFSWTEKSSAPAVAACHRALERWIAVRDPAGRAQYRMAQQWYRRHALRASAEGGLFPDLFVRRFLDDIELSWASEPPFSAPRDFDFVSEPGMARLPVADVAEPLWEALSWFASSPPPGLGDEDIGVWRDLCRKIEAVPAATERTVARAYAPARVLEVADSYLRRIGREELIREDVTPEHPFAAVLSPAVAMFGGVDPSLGCRDIELLCSVMSERQGLGDDDLLGRLVKERRGARLGIPHKDGYMFAEELLDELGLPGDEGWIDVHAVVRDFGIVVRETSLDTTTIRGVALAGEEFGPTIVVNGTSIYNVSPEGRRFTLAHELCHVLYDRTRARRVAHVSGPWVAPEVEKRANAFAAYLLMPRALLLRHLRGRHPVDGDVARDVAAALRVSETALVEHLYNLDLIAEWDRERLRVAFRG